jgi:shikimate kinase / 3-dehydroquinate synthase
VVGPLDRHVAVIGFMGAGKSTLGKKAARRAGRPFLDVDALVEAEAGSSVAELFARDGEARFRELEEACARSLLAAPQPSVIALGGGAVESPRTREALRAHATTVWIDVSVEAAWERARGTDRPLARDERRFRELHEHRRALYDEAADFIARDVDDVVLAAAGVHVERGGLQRLGSLVPGEGGPVALVADATVGGIHGAAAQLALARRLAGVHEVPTGEHAKTPAVCERLWRGIALGRDGMLVALGGGATTDTTGFVAATLMRGIDWVAVPTTLVGQVDAAIGGKTGINLPEAKNQVGAFHWPVRTVIDQATLATLPAQELANGAAEVVKTGLLAGEPLWDLPEAEQVRRTAAYKAAVCMRDPHDRGPRAELNLGHTFAHALEAASDYALPHGRAVALGLLAALRLSGLPTDVVDERLRPRPVRVDRERAWAALLRDKKAVGGTTRLVLLERPGQPRIGVELPVADVRDALDALIAA